MIKSISSLLLFTCFSAGAHATGIDLSSEQSFIDPCIMGPTGVYRNTRIQEIIGPTGAPGPQGIQGEPGPQGEPGTSSSSVYGFYYKLSNDGVATETAIIFDNIEVETGGLSYDSKKGSIYIPEDGDYSLTYRTAPLGTDVLAIGILVNETSVLPASVYKVLSSTKGNMAPELIGHITTSLKMDDYIQVVNLSNVAFQYKASELKYEPVNASLSISKQGTSRLTKEEQEKRDQELKERSAQLELKR